MAGTTAYPGALDTTTELPAAASIAGNELDGDGNANLIHSNLHGVGDEAIVALETKLGTGASTPVAGAALMGSAAGVSGWDTSPTFAGVLSTDDTTDSTSGTTGSIHTDGGIGAVKNIVAGRRVYVGADTATQQYVLAPDRGNNVSTATLIWTGSAYGGIIFVNGVTTGNSAGFCDIIYVPGGGVTTAPAVLHSQTSFGSPAARTYTQPSTGQVNLAMASGTYDVSCLGFYFPFPVA